MTSKTNALQTGPANSAGPVCDSNHSSLNTQHSAPKLLAVDCGLKTGLALFTLSGDLLWYRSHNLGSRARLKKFAWKTLHDIEGLTEIVIEGGGDLAEVWLHFAERCRLKASLVQAEQWRREMLLPRQQRTGRQAKQVADELAREIIEQAGAARPTALRHDAAEAILVGWWALQRINA